MLASHTQAGVCKPMVTSVVLDSAEYAYIVLREYIVPRENSDGKVTRPQIDDSEEVRLRPRPLRMI